MNNPPDKTPFNSPRDPAQPPYHLRNGILERAEIDRHEAEHRRRLGMKYDDGNPLSQRKRFDAWMTSKYPSCDAHVLNLMWEAWQAAQS